MPAEVTSAEEALAQNTFETQACTLAAIALLLYETCHSAELEWAYIWARRRARMIALIVTIRHLQFLALTLNSISYAIVSPEMCQTFSLINAIVVVIPYFGWASFLGWRAYALSSSNAFLALAVSIFSVSFVVPSLIEMVWTTRLYIPTTTPPTCATEWKSPEIVVVLTYSLYISRSANLLAEVAVLALTCRATYRAWLSSRKSNLPTSLPDILYENGIICFFVGTVLHGISLVFSLTPLTQERFANTVSVFRDVLITIFVSRFILELARVGAQVSDAGQRTGATREILTTQWTGEISDVPSQWTLDDEYNGRGFDKDIETFQLEQRYEA